MKQLSFLTFAVLVLFSSCKDDKQDVKLNFKLTYDGEPLVMFEEYTYPTGEKMLFNRFSFYLSDLAINHKDGQDQLMDVRYLNFTVQNSTLSGAEEGITLEFNDLDDKDYEQLFMSIGVNAANNALTPADFGLDNDLSKTSEYWPGWESYVFTKTEGQIDFGGPQMTGFSLHTGSDAAKVDFLLDISELESSNNNTVEISIDLMDYFGNDKIYDIQTYPSLHALAQLPQVFELSNNLTESLTVNMK
jgi:hypothetical protein